MLIEICALLWCETTDPNICTLQRLSPGLYKDHKVEKEYRHLPMLINGEMQVYEQRLEKKMGCWAERTND